MATPTEALLVLSGMPALSAVTKATVIFGAGLTAAALSRHARAAVRHLILAATFGSALAMPIAATLGPSLDVRMPAPMPPATPPTLASPSVRTAAAAPMPTVDPTEREWPTPGRLLLVAWAVGATLTIAPLVPMAFAVRRLRRTAVPWPEGASRWRPLLDRQTTARVAVMRHEDATSPITFGWWRPAVVVPAEAPAWSDADLHRALVHEIEHVRRHDWAVHVAARAICAAYWFHPLAWTALRRLGLEAERACDDAVVLRMDASDYAMQLVHLAERLSPMCLSTALGMARRSDLSTRVEALLDGAQRRGPAGVAAAVGILATTALVVLTLAPLRAVAALAEPALDQRSAGMADPRPARIQGPLDRGLFEAAQDGDVERIEELLRAGANANVSLVGDGSPLIAAARRGHRDAVRLLLDRGANPSLGVPGDGSPLIAAAGGDHADVVALLLERGAELDQVVPGDENALIQACSSGALSAVRLLVARGADVNARVWAPSVRGDEWRTPLGQARRGRHAAVVALLTAAGAHD